MNEEEPKPVGENQKLIKSWNAWKPNGLFFETVSETRDNVVLVHVFISPLDNEDTQ